MENVLHVVFDGCLLVGLVYLFLSQRLKTQPNNISLVQEQLQQLKTRENELIQTKQAMNDYLCKFRSVLESISQQLHQPRTQMLGDPDSEEARELKQFTQNPARVDTIPTLAEVERTQASLSGQMGLDLRTVLSDQLA